VPNASTDTPDQMIGLHCSVFYPLGRSGTLKPEVLLAAAEAGDHVDIAWAGGYVKMAPSSGQRSS